MNQHAKKSGNPVVRVLTLIMAILAVALAYAYFTREDKDGGRISPSGGTVATNDTATGEQAQTTESRPDPVADPALTTLVGRWLREDGGYVIEISQVNADGTLKAAYFNPSPINVSKAAAAREGGALKVGIELRDENYPGCLYTLVLDRELDQLQGTYFQAAMRQTYPVRFIRLKESESTP